jgi:hypothetical protein
MWIGIKIIKIRVTVSFGEKKIIFKKFFLMFFLNHHLAAENSQFIPKSFYSNI